MSLPDNIDPVTFKIIKKPVIKPRINTTYQPYNYVFDPRTCIFTVTKRSLWEKFSRRIASIGNWIDTCREDFESYFCLAVFVLYVLIAVWQIFDAWVSKGFWSAVGTTILGIVGWFLLMIALGIFIAIIPGLIRRIFWNGWSFVGTVAGVVLLLLLSSVKSCSNSEDSGAQEETAVVQPATPKYEMYRVTAKVLNVREYPWVQSHILGTVTKNQKVRVSTEYGKSNDGWVKIDYKGAYGYVKAEYLDKYTTY